MDFTKNITGNKKLIRFIIVAFSLYIAWFIVYDHIIEPDGRINDWLNGVVASNASTLLHWFGYQTDTVPGIQQSVVRIDKVETVRVGNPCNGLELFALFIGFIICFPGNWKNKAWFIPLGVLLIHYINVIRAAALALNLKYDPESLDFNHHYTFTVVVYLFIFGLWIFWANKLSKSGPNNPKNPTAA